MRRGPRPTSCSGRVIDPWPRWAYEDRLVDLQGTLGPVLDLFDPDTIQVSTLLNGRRANAACTPCQWAGLPITVHVWSSLLERAGFTVDIPREWEAFWSFWCDQVQPACARGTGRDDIWGVGLPMSAAALTVRHEDQFQQFSSRTSAPWLSNDAILRSTIPQVRAGMIKALEAYTAIWRKGCTPPDAASWNNTSNNKAFLAQTVVMTPNPSLSIPAALARRGPTTTTRTPPPSTGRWAPTVSRWSSRVTDRAVVFKAGGGNLRTAEDFVRFLAEEGWLAHWLTFAGDQCCRRCASWSSSRSGSTRAIRTACAMPSRS